MLKLTIPALFLFSTVAQATCTAEQQPPAGKPDNFKINVTIHQGKLFSKDLF